MRTRASLILIGAAFLFLLSLLAGFEAQGWPLDLTGHFRVQYLVISLVLLPLLALTPATKIRTAGLVLVIPAASLNLYVLAPFCFAAKPKILPTNNAIRLLQFNVNTANRAYSAFDKLIEKVQPNLLCLEEIDDGWKTHLESLKDKYPYQLIRPRPDNFGIALLSQYPILKAQLLPLGSAHVPTILARLNLNPKDELPILVAVTHPVPPILPEFVHMRDEQIKLLADELIKAKKNKDPVIVAGDLNTTPWSSTIRDFTKRANLNDSILGRPWQSSWPTNNFLLSIPIDYIFTSPEITCLQRSIEHNCGSDHYPVSVLLQLPETKKRQIPSGKSFSSPPQVIPAPGEH